MGRWLVAAISWLLWMGGAVAAAESGTALGGDPLRVRNLAPATYLFGLPRPLGESLAPGAAELTFSVEHANNFTAQVSDDLAVLFDGSTTVSSLALRRGAGQRWEWGLEVPFVHHSGGFTDGFIEDFHDLFGFPEANRKDVPRGRLEYRVLYRGEELINVTDEGGHLGDVRGWFGYRLLENPARQLAVRAMVEAPTGRTDDLTGSDGTDVTAALELVEHGWLAALDTSVTMMAAVTAPEQSGPLSELQKDLVLSGHLGVHYALTPRIALRAQLDGHSDVIDSGVSAFGGAALLGTLGGSFTLSQATRLDVGLVEDLTPDHAPDVVFLLNLSARL